MMMADLLWRVVGAVLCVLVGVVAMHVATWMTDAEPDVVVEAIGERPRCAPVAVALPAKTLVCRDLQGSIVYITPLAAGPICDTRNDALFTEQQQDAICDYADAVEDDSNA